MLVVCALALVVAAAAYLVLGLLGGDIGHLYVSMALCAGSLAVLVASARISRPHLVAAGPQPDPVAPEGLDVGAPVDVVASVDVDAPLDAAGEDDAWWAPPPSEPAPAPAASTVPPGFPIADYDRLDQDQILPLLPELWPDEVRVVAARERATRARPAVLDALATVADDPSLAFPIAEYDALAAEQITPLLERLDVGDLDVVRTAERGGAARVGVLVAVANELASRR